MQHPTILNNHHYHLYLVSLQLPGRGSSRTLAHVHSYVNAAGHTFKPQIFACGVSQGSVLDFLLIIFYTSPVSKLIYSRVARWFPLKYRTLAMPMSVAHNIGHMDCPVLLSFLQGYRTTSQNTGQSG